MTDTPNPHDDLLAAADGHIERGAMTGSNCFACGGSWPCLTSRLAAALRALQEDLGDAHLDQEGLRRTLDHNERLKVELGALVRATGFEPFGLIWRPKAGSRRWQHRVRREGRAYPATAEIVDVFRAVPTDGATDA